MEAAADVREEIAILYGLIDVALDSGITDDPLLRACATTLRERRELLEYLEDVDEAA